MMTNDLATDMEEDAITNDQYASRLTAVAISVIIPKDIGHVVNRAAHVTRSSCEDRTGSQEGLNTHLNDNATKRVAVAIQQGHCSTTSFPTQSHRSCTATGPRPLFVLAPFNLRPLSLLSRL